MPPRKGVNNRRGAASREQILDAAVELFAEKGYRGSTLAMLGDRVGMSHVGILRHFGTKENLLRAVLARRIEFMGELKEELEGKGLSGFTSLPNASLPDALTRLATVLRAENLNPDDPLHDDFVKELLANRSFLAAEIRRAQRRGEMRRDIDPNSKAIEIMAFATGLETLWLLAPNEVNREKVLRSYGKSLADTAVSRDPKKAAPQGAQRRNT
jgi:AcrR family transcriptional regulator